MTEEIVAPKRAVLEAYLAATREDWHRAEVATLALLGSIRYHRAQTRAPACDAQEANV